MIKDNSDNTEDQPFYYYRLFRVKKQGKETTVSLEPSLAVSAAKQVGGMGKLKQTVQQIVDAYNPDEASMKNCSGYVAKTLEARLQQPSSRARH